MDIIRPPANISRRLLELGTGHSLADQMRLTSSRADLELYFSIMQGVGRLCDIHFPHNKRKPRDDHLYKAFIEKITDIHPCIARYQDAWPIKTMITQHRSMRRTNSLRGIIRTDAEIARWIRMFSKRTFQEEHESSFRLLRKRDAHRIHSQDKGNSRASSSQQNTIVEAPANVSRRASLSATPVQSETHGAVTLFLESLAQDLSPLLSVFKNHGVVDERTLQSVVRIGNWRSWLYAWVKEGHITELQFKMISDGLERMV